MIERRRERILKEEGYAIKEVHDSIKEMREAVEKTAADLAHVDEFLEEFYAAAVADHDFHHARHDAIQVAHACRKYIHYARGVLSSEALDVVMDGILHYRDHDDSELISEEEKHIAYATDLTTSLTQSLQLKSHEQAQKKLKSHKKQADQNAATDEEASKDKASAFKHEEIMDASFIKGWAALVGKMPYHDMKSGDAHRLHLDYLREVSEIRSAIPLLQGIAYCIQQEKDLSALAKPLADEAMHALKTFPIIELDEVSASDLTSPSRSQQKLEQDWRQIMKGPPIDVPRVVGRIFEAASQKKAQQHVGRDDYLSDAFKRWLNKD